MGSNPIARSHDCGLQIDDCRLSVGNPQSTIRNLKSNGVVAKWEGKGLQNPHHGFKSRRRLCKMLITGFLSEDCANPVDASAKC